MQAGERIVTSPRDIVLNAWKTFSSRDAERIAALFTEDAEWIAPEGNATAVALDRRGGVMSRPLALSAACQPCNRVG
jgi:ketosteroid isomerase-like protein